MAVITGYPSWTWYTGVIRPRAWGSSNDPDECSDLTVGRRMLDQLAVPPEELIDEVVRATLLSVGNWG
jgi:hypothetical protein